MAEIKIKMSREELEKNIAESIRAVAEHIIQCADNYARGVNDDARGIKIVIDFSIDALPTVTFTQDVCPRTWINAVLDGRCRIWTAEGRTELFEQDGDGGTNEGPAHERRPSTKAFLTNEGNQRTMRLSTNEGLFRGRRLPTNERP